MMPTRLLHAVASMALCLAGIAGTAAAQSADPAPACATIADPAARLACYDAAFPPAADAASGDIGREDERSRALRDFGLDRVQLRERNPERMREISPDTIEATVAAVERQPTGHRLVTLDNGQAWLLTEVTSKGYLASGDRVSIRKAAMGNYMLLTPQRVPLRTRRIH